MGRARLSAIGALVIFGSFMGASPASAFWSYIKQYQVGIDYTSSYSEVDATYDMAAAATPPLGCQQIDAGAKQTCRVSMAAGTSSGFGFFLQQAFRRQGLFYVKPDMGFGVRYLTGKMSDAQAEEQAERGLPLQSMSFALAAVIVKPMLTLGITPATTWPDVLVSIGPALQVAAGTVEINAQREPAAMATTSELLSGFFELEAVFVRFGDGAISAFVSKDFTGSGRGTKFYPRTIAGMDNVRANFRRSVSGDFYGLGMKLVLNWP